MSSVSLGQGVGEGWWGEVGNGEVSEALRNQPLVPR